MVDWLNFGRLNRFAAELIHPFQLPGQIETLAVPALLQPNEEFESFHRRQT